MTWGESCLEQNLLMPAPAPAKAENRIAMIGKGGSLVIRFGKAVFECRAGEDMKWQAGEENTKLNSSFHIDHEK
jgi:hypothetical protein